MQILLDFVSRKIVYLDKPVRCNVAFQLGGLSSFQNHYLPVTLCEFSFEFRLHIPLNMMTTVAKYSKYNQLDKVNENNVTITWNDDINFYIIT